MPQIDKAKLKTYLETKSNPTLALFRFIEQTKQDIDKIISETKQILENTIQEFKCMFMMFFSN